MYVLFTTIMVNFLTDELLDGLLKDQGWENSPLIPDLNQKSGNNNVISMPNVVSLTW